MGGGQTDRPETPAVGKACPRDPGAGCLCQLGIRGQGSPVVGVLWAFLGGERALQTDRHSDKEGGCAALPAMLLAKYSGYHSVILDVRGPENGTISLPGAGLATTSEIRQHAQAIGGGGPHFMNPVLRHHDTCV